MSEEQLCTFHLVLFMLSSRDLENGSGSLNQYECVKNDTDTVRAVMIIHSFTDLA